MGIGNEVMVDYVYRLSDTVSIDTLKNFNNLLLSAIDEE